MTSTPDHESGSAPEPGAPYAISLPGARFDPVTGAELTGREGTRRRGSYALQQGEPVMSFNLVSSLLPMASGTAPQTYRWALGLGLLVPVAAGALGYLTFAFVAAALLVPVVYLIYMYDVNQWDDQPLGVTLGAVGVAGVLGIGFTWLWHGLLDSGAATAGAGAGLIGINWSSLLVLCLLVPLVSEVLKQVGPVLLSRRPAFDDLIDALTFGVAAGSAYAAAETLVVNRALFSSLGHIDQVDSGFWLSLVLSAAVVKPVVYGAATGIAMAAFSGVGRGYVGFKAPYLRGLAEAIAANVVFQLAMFLAGRVGGPRGAVLGLVLGTAVAVVLVLRLRHLLHVGILEAALEGSPHREGLKDTAHGTAWCPSCDLPLVDGANFCVACGTAVRAASKVSRRRNTALDDAAAAPATPEPPRDHKQTALVVGSALAVLLAAGLLGQVAAAASSDVETPSTEDIQITPDLSGSTIDPAPSPAPAPGPSVSPSDTASSSSYLSGETGSRAQNASAQSTSGDTFLLGSKVKTADGGVRLRLAPGWQVLASNATRIVAAKGNAVFTVDITQPPADTGAMMQSHLQGLLTQGVQDLQVTQPTQAALPSANFVAAQRLNLRGLIASQQGGSIPVEGFAFYLVRQDGVGITVTGIFNQGEMQRVPGLVKEYGVMLSSLLGG
jgi:hypothetical protein